MSGGLTPFCYSHIFLTRMPELELEQIGNLINHPLGELLVEINAASLSGSVRLSHNQHKIVIYFRNGLVIYAASNQKAHRLTELISQWRVLTESQMAQVQDCKSDQEMVNKLTELNLLNQSSVQALQTEQMGRILETALLWTEGEWIFNPLLRLRENADVPVETSRIMFEVARKLPAEFILSRLNSSDLFTLRADAPKNLSLSTEEFFILSRLDHLCALEELKYLCQTPQDRTFSIIYRLWLAGFIRRHNWSAAFSEEKIRRILSAKISLSQIPVAKPVIQPPPIDQTTVPEEPDQSQTPEENILELNDNTEVDERTEVESFLKTIEQAESHYEVLGVENDAAVSAIKSVYFKLAKRYHPDRFHQDEWKDLRPRVQQAFTLIAQAYSQLSDAKLRELYDFKLRRTTANRPKSNGNSNNSTNANAPTGPQAVDFEHAEELFQHGVAYYEQEDYNQAIAFLARAVQIAPEEAKYHAHYGRALTKNPKYKFQAEGELQKAVKLDGKNPEIRLMLAEFYKEMNLNKRAVAELQKLLTFAPNNTRARQLLDSLN